MKKKKIEELAKKGLIGELAGIKIYKPRKPLFNPPKPAEWEIAFDKKFDGELESYHGSETDEVKKFICSLLKSERERIVKKIEEEIKKEPNLEVASGMAHILNILK